MVVRRWGSGTLQGGPQTGYLLAAGKALMGISAARNISIMPPPQGPGPHGSGARGRAGALRCARSRTRGARRAVGAGRRLGLLPGAGRPRAGLPAGAHRRACARVRPRAHAAGAPGGSSTRAVPAAGRAACFLARRTPGAPCCGRWRAACWAWEAVSVARAARPLPLLLELWLIACIALLCWAWGGFTRCAAALQVEHAVAAELARIDAGEAPGATVSAHARKRGAEGGADGERGRGDSAERAPGRLRRAARRAAAGGSGARAKGFG